MELDELKKSWNAKDEQLKGHPLVNEKELEKLMAAGKTHTRQRLKRLNLWQRFSLWAGIILLLLLIPACLWVPDAMTDKNDAHIRIVILLAFLTVSIVTGLIWDWKTFRWIRTIQVDKMSVVEVSRRMTIFRRSIRHEIWAACVWIVAFNALNFWVMGYHLAPASTQILVIALLLVTDVLIIYLLYKKVIYKYLNDIQKDIEEMKELCTE